MSSQIISSEDRLPLVAVTMGDPTGIGPEIVVRALAERDLSSICRCIVVGDRAALERALKVTETEARIVESEGKTAPRGHNRAAIFLRSTSALKLEEMKFGAPGPSSGEAAYAAIREAARMCLTGEADAMATAPISKEALNLAGHEYPGHTELLAEATGTDEFVMMLAGKNLRVSLVTIHEALRDVPTLLTLERILTTIRVTHRDVHRHFCRNPRIAVLALNPHCGEGGLFGDEERRIIEPAVAAAKAEGIDASGPHSADTLFHFAALGEYDAVVAMYHDQGLIPLKLLHFDDGVNVTLGLPIIRTSVDHGTAFSLAGTGKASHGSLSAAIRMAAEMALTRSADFGRTAT